MKCATQSAPQKPARQKSVLMDKVDGWEKIEKASVPSLVARVSG